MGSRPLTYLTRDSCASRCLGDPDCAAYVWYNVSRRSSGDLYNCVNFKQITEAMGDVDDADAACYKRGTHIVVGVQIHVTEVILVWFKPSHHAKHRLFGAK